MRHNLTRHLLLHPLSAGMCPRHAFNIHKYSRWQISSVLYIHQQACAYAMRSASHKEKWMQAQ